MQSSTSLRVSLEQNLSSSSRIFFFCLRTRILHKIFSQENLTSSYKKKTRPNFSYFSPLPKRFEWGHTVRIVAILEPHWMLDRGRLVHIVVPALHFLLEMFDFEAETVRSLLVRLRDGLHYARLQTNAFVVFVAHFFLNIFGGHFYFLIWSK